MNVAGVFLMSDTRQRTKRSRGFDFLALAMRHHRCVGRQTHTTNAAPSM
jgi:hypothetical protein